MHEFRDLAVLRPMALESRYYRRIIAKARQAMRLAMAAAMLLMICCTSIVDAIGGGELLSTDQYVSVVKILRNPSSLMPGHCTGVLITRRHVLTAAHCHDPLNPDPMEVRVGDEEIWFSGYDRPFYGVDNWFRHPTCDDSDEECRWGMDLMILELDKEVEGFEYDGRTVEVEPWPILGSDEPIHLSWPPYPTLTVEADFSSWIRHVGYAGNKTKRTIIAQVMGSSVHVPEFYTNGAVRLQNGDSGGPVLQYRNGQEVVVGVFSGELGLCYRIDADIYQWIHDVVTELDSDLLSSDYDSDGIGNLDDNCPLTAGVGEDEDRGEIDQADGVGYDCDNCRNRYNGGQMDFDGDGTARGCDNCPDHHNPGQEDQDGDGIGDLCDNCKEVDNPDQMNHDDDGRGDVCDNCIEFSNPGQENCDWQGDGDFNEGWQGDACDPDICLRIDGPRFSSRVIEPSSHTDTEITYGEIVSFGLLGVGGLPTNDSPPRYRLDFLAAPVRVAFCECDSPYHCRATCPMTGELSDVWHDLTWQTDNPRGDVSEGEGVIPGMRFERPAVSTSTSNYLEFNWDWRNDVEHPEGTYVALWVRPDVFPELWDWPSSKGNTYSDPIQLRVNRAFVPWIPHELEHGFWPFGGAISVSPGLDINMHRICPIGETCPWRIPGPDGLQLPSLFATSYGFDSPLSESPYALEHTERAALSALAVRHQWTGSGFVSGYLPVKFQGTNQLDLIDFTSTVMAEKAPRTWYFYSNTPFGSKNLQKSMSIWTFGGMDRRGRFYDELWRGQYNHSLRSPAYQFAPIRAKGGPSPRSKAILMPDLDGQRLVLMGGLSKRGLLDDLWTYNILSRKWQKQSVTVPRTLGLAESAWLVSGDYGYIYGGRSKEGKNDELWRLDMDRLQFERLSEGTSQFGPGERLNASLSIDAQKEILYLYGGQSKNGWNNDLYLFDLTTDNWEQLHGLCQPDESCPPLAVDSALLPSGVSGAITLAIGTPTTEWPDTAHEWRYLLSEQKWIQENLLRNDIGN